MGDGATPGAAASGRLLSVNVARMRLIQLSGQTVKTGIFKYPAEGRHRVRDDQVGADRQADYEVHGGPDKAVYAYADEDYRWWASELGRDGPTVEPGLFGENLTTSGIDLSRSEVGSRWRVGTALLEVSEPRLPCSKLGYRMQDPRFVRRFAQANRPGAYLRIVEEGELGAGDEIEVLDRPGHGVDMALVSRAMLGDRALLPRLLEAEALSDRWHEWALERMA
jgi:MOSC domain-containing protein YiiM